MKRAAKAEGIPTNIPWYDLTEAQQRFIYDGRGSWPGIRGFFEALERKKYKLHVRVFLSKYRGYATCPDCRGQRLRPEARAVTLSSGPDSESRDQKHLRGHCPHDHRSPRVLQRSHTLTLAAGNRRQGPRRGPPAHSLP